MNATEGSWRPVAGRGYTRQSWSVAAGILKQFQPIRWFISRVMRPVFGKPGTIGMVPPYSFDVLASFLGRALADPLLLRRMAAVPGKVDSNRAAALLGHDIAAASCFIHAVCVRVCLTLPERVWKPIIDDALLRAVIGFSVGSRVTSFGSGRGMLAGFSGRFGLAIQMAAGDGASAHRTLERLAAGSSLYDVGFEIYGCDPLQVSALSLTLAGCHRSAALGLISFSAAPRKLDEETQRWLFAFIAVEHLRMGRYAQVTDQVWNALGFTDDRERNELKQYVQNVQRRGHRWHFMTVSQEGEEVPAEQE